MTTRRGWKTYWSTLSTSALLLVKQGNMTWKRGGRIPSAVYPKDFGTWYPLGPQPKQRSAVLPTYPEALTIIHPLFYI